MLHDTESPRRQRAQERQRRRSQVQELLSARAISRRCGVLAEFTTVVMHAKTMLKERIANLEANERIFIGNIDELQHGNRVDNPA